MRSEEIDLAFYCNHMAVHLVDEDDRFTIYAPVIMNSEVLAYDQNLEDIRHLGIGQKRNHIKTLALKSYPQIQEVSEMTGRALPYSLIDGQVDAVALDVTKAVLVPDFTFAPLSKNDFISYVLVVRKDLIGTPAFESFLSCYNQAAEQLNQTSTLIDKMGMDEAFWEMADLQFLPLDQ